MQSSISVFNLLMISTINLFISCCAVKPLSLADSPRHSISSPCTCNFYLPFFTIFISWMYCCSTTSSLFKFKILASPFRSWEASCNPIFGSCKLFDVFCTDNKIGYQKFNKDVKGNYWIELRSDLASHLVSLENSPSCKCSRLAIMLPNSS